jgi:predicted enzyme related to lactoylglutathione lyase
MQPGFRLASFVLLVSDMELSKKFYRDFLGQEIAMDIGKNVGFTSGLALWQKDYALNVIHGSEVRPQKGNDVELYFETRDIEEAWEKVKYGNIPVLHEPREQPWCQRVFRIYDPDRFVVEIAEPMDAVVVRLHCAGLSEEDIMKKTFMPADIVRQMLV